MGTPYQAGRRAEYAAIRELKTQGYQAVRTAGSHGPFDVVAWTPNELLFVQVKKTSYPPAFANILKSAADELSAAGFPTHVARGVEIWIRCIGSWYVYPLPFKHDTRRVT